MLFGTINCASTHPPTSQLSTGSKKKATEGNSIGTCCYAMGQHVMTLSIVFVLLASHFVTQKRGTTGRRSEAACDLKSQFPLHTSRRGEEFMNPLGVAARRLLNHCVTSKKKTFSRLSLISILLSHLRRATPDRWELIFHVSEPFAFKVKWTAAWKSLYGQSFSCFSARWTFSWAFSWKLSQCEGGTVGMIKS